MRKILCDVLPPTAADMEAAALVIRQSDPLYPLTRDDKERLSKGLLAYRADLQERHAAHESDISEYLELEIQAVDALAVWLKLPEYDTLVDS